MNASVTDHRKFTGARGHKNQHAISFRRLGYAQPRKFFLRGAHRIRHGFMTDQNADLTGGFFLRVANCLDQSVVRQLVYEIFHAHHYHDPPAPPPPPLPPPPENPPPLEEPPPPPQPRLEPLLASNSQGKNIPEPRLKIAKMMISTINPMLIKEPPDPSLAWLSATVAPVPVYSPLAAAMMD